jgi:hypothetical protein
MSSVVISGDTSGAITLAAPAVAGTNTATLPAATGTVMVSGNMPAFSAYQSSAQTLASGTWVKLQFQTKEFDTNSNFDNATNYRFTPTVAGYYQVSGGLGLGATVTSVFVQIYKNAVGFKTIFGINTSTVNACGSALVYLNGSTDYIELYGYAAIGQVLVAAANSTYFQAVMVRSA